MHTAPELWSRLSPTLHIHKTKALGSARSTFSARPVSSCSPCLRLRCRLGSASKGPGGRRPSGGRPAQLIVIEGKQAGYRPVPGFDNLLGRGEPRSGLSQPVLHGMPASWAALSSLARARFTRPGSGASPAPRAAGSMHHNSSRDAGNGTQTMKPVRAAFEIIRRPRATAFSRMLLVRRAHSRVFRIHGCSHSES